MHARSIWWSVKQASDCHLLVEGLLQTRLRKESSMRTSTFRKITASFAALAVIASLGTSPRAREGWWGWRPFRRRRDVHWRGWFSRRRIWWARFSSGRKNVWRRIQSSPLLWRLQRLRGEPVQSVAKSIFVALYVLKRGEASPTGHRGASSGCTEERSGAAYMSQGLWAVCLKVRRLHKTSAQLSWSKAFAHVTREAPVSKAR